MGWLKAGDQTILALHKRVITHNSRVQVSHEDNRVSFLAGNLNIARGSCGRKWVCLFLSPNRFIIRRKNLKRLPICVCHMAVSILGGKFKLNVVF